MKNEIDRQEFPLLFYHRNSFEAKELKDVDTY